MDTAERISRIAALVGEPTHARALAMLLTQSRLSTQEIGRALNLSSAATAKTVNMLSDGGLVRVQSDGRRHYCQLSNDKVATTLRAILDLANEQNQISPAADTSQAALRHARICHNHLAGEMGTRMYRSLFMRGVLVRHDDGLMLTETGRQFVEAFGISLDNIGWGFGQSTLCRPCLNWSKQNNHLSGSLGGAFLLRLYALGWAKREPRSQIVRFTSEGQQAFAATFPVAG